MSERCGLISFGTINKYYFLIPAGAISYIFLVLIEKESKFFSEGKKHPIIYILIYSLGLTLSFIFLIIYKIFNSRKRSKVNIAIIEPKLIISNQKQIVSNKEKMLWILLVSVIDYITMVFYTIFYVDSKEYLNYWLYNIVSLSLFSLLILKTKLHKHHYLSIITVVVFGVILDIIFNKYSKIDLVSNLISFMTETLFSLDNILYKFFMLKKFIKSYEILFYQGIIELLLVIITLIITTNIGYLDNFYDFINTVDKKEVLIYILLIINEFAYNSIAIIIIDMLSPFHIFLLIVFSELINYFFYLNEEGNILISIISIVFILICIFMCLVFIEIIQLNFLGLSYMTQKNIELRAKHDFLNINKKTNSDLEIDYKGYNIDLKDDQYELNDINSLDDNFSK